MLWSKVDGHVFHFAFHGLRITIPQFHFPIAIFFRHVHNGPFKSFHIFDARVPFRRTSNVPANKTCKRFDTHRLIAFTHWLLLTVKYLDSTFKWFLFIKLNTEAIFNWKTTVKRKTYTAGVTDRPQEHPQENSAIPNIFREIIWYHYNFCRSSMEEEMHSRYSLSSRRLIVRITPEKNELQFISLVRKRLRGRFNRPMFPIFIWVTLKLQSSFTMWNNLSFSNFISSVGTLLRKHRIVMRVFYG